MKVSLASALVVVFARTFSGRRIVDVHEPLDSGYYPNVAIADSYLGSVMSGIQPNKYGKIPNILYVDFAEWADPVSVANQMNARL